MASARTSSPVLKSSLFIAVLLCACVAGPAAPGDPGGIRPFHAASFDHTPTPDEIDRELQAFLATSPGKDQHDVVYPRNNTTVDPGHKLVTLAVKTGNNSGDGMDDADDAYFLGTWLTNGKTAPAYTEKFILNIANRDDLNKGATNVFYYLLPLDYYVVGATEDQFQRGRIGNTSTDRWRCEYIWLEEKNHAGINRNQFLNFNTSVERPSPEESNDLLALDPSWLAYGTATGGGGGDPDPGCALPSCP